MKKILIIFVLILTCGIANAQQDALYSQYMFNPFAINPAYAGSRQAFSGVALHRSQWAGMDGAPQTSSLALHGPIKGKKFALGLNAMSETIGPSNNFSALATYAYHLRFSKGTLSLGLRGGLYGTTLDRDMLTFEDGSDQYNQTGAISTVLPTFDFGAYYYTDRFYAGLASTHLGGGSTRMSGEGGVEFKLQQHYILTTGYAIPMKGDVVFKPSTVVRYVAGAPVNLDVNASFLFKRVFWLGTSVRSSGSIMIVTEYNITDFLRVGYSYDIVMNGLKRYNRGSHEIFVGFDFNIKKTDVVSPRYM